MDDTHDVERLTLCVHLRQLQPRRPTQWPAHTLYSCRRYRHKFIISLLERANKRERAAYLDLDVEHRIRVDLEAERRLDVVREALFVALLHHRPLLLERRVVDVLEQALCASHQHRSMLAEGTTHASSLVRSLRNAAFGILSVSLMRLLRPGLHCEHSS